MYTTNNTDTLMAFDFDDRGRPRVTDPRPWQDPKHAAQAALDAINAALDKRDSRTPYIDAEVLHAAFVQPPADFDTHVLVFSVMTDECMFVTFQVQDVA